MHVVLSVGGSMVYPEGGPDLDFLKSLGNAIKKSKHSFGILTGGGTVARKYAKAARALGASEYDADSIAITSTKQNAQLVIASLKNAKLDVYDKVIDNFEEAKVPAHQFKAVVMGGTIPGITTDTDSVLLAEAIGARRLVNISNVDGVYDSNPKTNKKARKYSQMSYSKLISLASHNDKRTAGTNFVFDMLACKLIARSKIETHFVSGKNLKDLENAIEGKKHNGTIVLI
jgi:uridylate kinase